MEHSMAYATTLTVNGVTRAIALDDPRVTLLDLLREQLDLTGTKKGCDRANAAPARCWSTAGGSIPVWRLPSVMTARTS
jgi:xanthine dehydrogenase iron-sulfur cluster and FAD-binding subunit A